MEQIPDPRQARGVRHPFQAILRLTLLGLVSGQTAMAHIAWYGRLHGETLKEPLGFVRDQAPRRATRSRTLAGAPLTQLPQAVSDWVARLASDQGMRAAVDGKWAKQSTDVSGNPLALVNVLAHDLKLRLAQWPRAERRYRFLTNQAGGVAGSTGPII